MIRARTALVAAIVGALLLMAAASAPGSTPGSGSVAVPSTTGQTVTDSWTGTILPASHGTSNCNAVSGDPTVDHHLTSVTVPSGIYSTLDAAFRFSISWTPGTPTEDTADEILTVVDQNGN